MEQKKLKAFQVLEEYGEPNAVIVFAEKNVVARRVGAEEIGAEFSDVSCVRVPWADEYNSFDAIPTSVLIGNGWTWYCQRCDAMINEDSPNHCTRFIVQNPEYKPTPERFVFCSEDCARRYEKAKE